MRKVAASNRHQHEDASGAAHAAAPAIFSILRTLWPLLSSLPIIYDGARFRRFVLGVIIRHWSPVETAPPRSYLERMPRSEDGTP